MNGNRGQEGVPRSGGVARENPSCEHESLAECSVAERPESPKADFSEESNEKVIFLLSRSSGLAPYSHEFVFGGSDPQLLSGFVAAMSSFMGEVTGLQETRWKTVFGSSSTLVVEGGEWIVGVLMVMRETSEMRSKLRSVVREFEESFAFLRNADGVEDAIFSQFDMFVMRVFVEDRLSEASVVLKGSDWRDIHVRYPSPSIGFKVTKFLYYLKSGESIKEAAHSQGLSIQEVKSLVSEAVWRNLVYMKYIPADDDILALSEKSSSVLLSPGNPMKISSPTLKMLASLNSRYSVSSLLKRVGSRYADRVLLEVGTLINQGYVQRIPLERRFVLLHECVLSRLMAVLARVVGPARTRRFCQIACNRGLEQHPMLGRIRFRRNLTARCVIDDTMTPADLDNMYEAVGYLIDRIQHHPLMASRVNKDIVLLAEDQCRRTWISHLMDTAL